MTNPETMTKESRVPPRLIELEKGSRMIALTRRLLPKLGRLNWSQMRSASLPREAMLMIAPSPCNPHRKLKEGDWVDGRL